MRHLLPCAAALAAALCGPAFGATSSFDTDIEGWQAIGDVAGTLNWRATGGNPGGHVSITDLTTGGVTYFVAPAKFLGDQSAAYGTTLGFDLMQVYSGSPNQFNDEDVILQSASLTLVYDTSVNPANGGWTSYAVPLAAGGWKVSSLAGPVATAQQMQSVLANLTGLRIRAEYQTGPDLDRLDNVTMVPEPATLALWGAGLGALMLRLRRR